MKEARYSRGDENVRVVQPADTAAWIWMPGVDVYGVAAYGDEAKARSLKGEAPAWFFRFRNDFTADGSPFRFDPYYEQQMYPGDTRIQLQILNALTADPRADGTPDFRVMRDDRLHLIAAGYDVWMEAILPLIREVVR